MALLCEALLLQPAFAQHRRDLARSQIPQQPVRLSGIARHRHTPGGKHRRRLQLVWNGSDDFDPCDLLQFTDLLDGEIGLADYKPLGRETLRNDHRPRVNVGGNAEALDQFCKINFRLS